VRIRAPHVAASAPRREVDDGLGGGPDRRARRF